MYAAIGPNISVLRVRLFFLNTLLLSLLLDRCLHRYYARICLVLGKGQIEKMTNFTF